MPAAKYRKKPDPDHPRGKPGKPTLYKKEYDALAKGYALLGYTLKEMAELFHVSEVTICAWKNRFPNFAKSISEGGAKADIEVAHALIHRAKGYSHKAYKFFKTADDQVIAQEYTEHYPPDTHAARFWLMNRQSARWRERIEVTKPPDSRLDELVAISKGLDPDEEELTELLNAKKANGSGGTVQ